MTDRPPLPNKHFAGIREMESFYLSHEDPIRQSGFGGGALRWRQEREPLLVGVNGDGDFLDVGCANGHLLECIVEWADERGHKLIPHGLDASAKLIELARRRCPEMADRLHHGDGWDWQPPRRYRFVYTLWDCVPEAYLKDYLERLLSEFVEPGGRLIVGAYGSRSRNLPPFDIAGFLHRTNFEVVGTAEGGKPPITSFAWVESER